uniref:Uncharacterized protein n=1 Tax=viral metagenome TaxID=1070528 RepID=A0A6C0I3I8_9ZZZZ
MVNNSFVLVTLSGKEDKLSLEKMLVAFKSKSFVG